MTDSNKPGQHDRKPVLLTGHTLTAVRVVWLLIAILTVILYLLSGPFRHQLLLEACSGINCDPGQISAEEMQALQNLGISPAFYAAFMTASQAILMLPYIVVAGVIFWRRSNEMMALLASLWMILFVTNSESNLALTAGIPLLHGLISYLGLFGWAILLPLFLLTFPDGRFIPRWTRWLFIPYALAYIMILALEPFLPVVAVINEAVGPVGWLSMQLIGAGSQVYRYVRVSDRVQRQQTKWIAFGLLAAILMLLLYFTVLINYGPLGELVATGLGTLAFLLIPIAMGISILRYRLWEIDRVINRTLVYGSLTAVLIAIYFGSVVLLQALFTAVSGQQSPISIVISTLVIAALFNPLRSHIQNFIDRRFYRSKYDAAQTVAQFAAATRDEEDLQTLSDNLLLILQESLQPEHASLWLNSAASDGARRVDDG